MPRGYKTCPKCGDKKVPSFLKKCKCGEVFSTKNRIKKPTNEAHKRITNFICRNLKNKLSPKEMAREIHVAKLMVKICYDDYDFLAKFTVPSWVKNTLLWFKTKDGKRFLERKYNEYLFKPEIKEDIFVDEGEIKGENIEYKKKKSLREFLDE